MSGHSKWSTIKRQKAANDQAKGKIFSKLAKAISIAAKSGGSSDPDLNPRLRMAVDQARAANMPKANIERAISRATEVGELLENTYEGFGPSGVGIIVEVATDNKNRAAQEIKMLFDRGGGRLAGPGAVSFNFESKGQITIRKSSEADILEIIDSGVEDFEEDGDLVTAYVDPQSLYEVNENLKAKGIESTDVRLVKKPKTLQKIEDKNEAKKVMDFIEKIEDLDDVQDVFTNADLPEEAFI